MRPPPAERALPNPFACLMSLSTMPYPLQSDAKSVIFFSTISYLTFDKDDLSEDMLRKSSICIRSSKALKLIKGINKLMVISTLEFFTQIESLLLEIEKHKKEK
jgi:hypothetical protein